MKQEVIKELSNSDLLETLENEKTQLTRLKLNHAVSPIENPNKIGEYKRTIARILTEMRKREKDAQSK
ncbi:MAG: 50S ribosomal protein L29 [Bacteroidales bacterium]|jgi:large subunit ribosomal protein L29|nr:50S ribosomal protein L29 [Bacteroidales bacterium]MDD3664748.1 50S ribosomal protein L29 [Bacteroidales bacterium]